MSAYYNEFNPFAAEWLRTLIAAGAIPEGDVDERSVEEVRPEDLAGYTQCHFFAGIGGWPLALRLAGIADSQRVWTGSPPCQGFSVAGKQLGFSDERHLAPQFLALIRECAPPIIFGEQVSAAIATGWWDFVQAHLEEQNYACGMAVLPSSGIGAPHKRERLFFGADRLALANHDDDKRAPSEAMAKRAAQRAATGRTSLSPGNLAEQATLMIPTGWPTPTANDFKGSGPTVIRKDGKNRMFDRLDYATERGLLDDWGLPLFRRRST